MEREFLAEMEDICAAIRKSGMEPYDQLYGYISKGKAEYITRIDNARERIQALNWDMVRKYVERLGESR